MGSVIRKIFNIDALGSVQKIVIIYFHFSSVSRYVISIQFLFYYFKELEYKFALSSVFKACRVGLLAMDSVSFSIDIAINFTS